MASKPRRARIFARHPSAATDAPKSVAFGGLPADRVSRLAHGVYVRSAEWDALFSESRLRTRADAVAARSSDTTAAHSHMTAAAFWTLPAYRVRSDRIDMTFPHPYTRRNAPDVVRHQAPLPEADVVVIDGHRVTSLDRTVYDVIRTSSLEAAIVVYDAALRLVAWDEEEKVYDLEAAARFRQLVDDRIRRGRGARGIRQARFISAIADGRAQLPGESITRLWMLLLGLPAPVLQYRVDLPNGRFYLLDIAWPELGRWMEFDGAAKYSDPDFMGGRTVDEVLADQRAREAEIKRLTGWRCDRHGFGEMGTIDEFATHLRSINLY